MNKRKDIIPNNLKEYRLKCGYTQKEVAEILGFTNTVAICHWEKGKNIPNLINLLKLCLLYKATSMQLYNNLLNTLEDQINKKLLVNQASYSGNDGIKSFGTKESLK